MEIIGIVGIIIAIIVLVTLIFKKYSLVVAAPIATIIVLITNQIPIISGMVGAENSYMVHFANFIIQNFAVFLLGAIFAKLLDKSGATISISRGMLKKVGTDRPYLVLISLYLIGLLLTLGGTNTFVLFFVIVPFARSVMQEADISWKLVTLPLFAGSSTITMTMLPGTPSVQNIVPSNSLGTPLTSAPILGVAASVVSAIFVLIVIRIELNKSLKKGEGFYSTARTDKGEASVDLNAETPPMLSALLPIITLISIIVIFSQVEQIILIALTAAIALAILLFRNYLPEYQGIFNGGANDAVNTIMTTGSTIAFGGVATSIPSFYLVFNALTSTPIPPSVTLVIATGLVSFITGSSTGAAGIIVENFAPLYIEGGLPPQVVHRLITIASGLFGVMPQTGLIPIYNKLAGFEMKESLGYQFLIVNGSHLLAIITVLVLVQFLI